MVMVLSFVLTACAQTTAQASWKDSINNAPAAPEKGSVKAYLLVTPTAPAATATPAPTPTLNLNTAQGQEQAWLNALAYGRSWVPSTDGELFAVDKRVDDKGIDNYVFYDTSLIYYNLPKPIYNPLFPDDKTKMIWQELRYVTNNVLDRVTFFERYGYYNLGVSPNSVTSFNTVPLIINGIGSVPYATPTAIP